MFADWTVVLQSRLFFPWWCFLEQYIATAGYYSENWIWEVENWKVKKGLRVSRTMKKATWDFWTPWWPRKAGPQAACCNLRSHSQYMPIEIVKVTVIGTKNLNIPYQGKALLSRWFPLISIFPRWDIFQFPRRVKSILKFFHMVISEGWPVSGVELRMEANDDMDIKLQDVAWEQKFGIAKMCFDFLYYGYEIDVSNVLYIYVEIFDFDSYMFIHTLHIDVHVHVNVYVIHLSYVFFFWGQPVFVGYPFMRPFIGPPHVERS